MKPAYDALLKEEHDVYFLLKNLRGEKNFLLPETQKVKSLYLLKQDFFPDKGENPVESPSKSPHVAEKEHHVSLPIWTPDDFS